MTAQRLNRARDAIEPSLGASVFQFSRQAIEDQPQADQNQFNRVLLQAPGVTQDSFGQLHVRGAHNDLQFRINGVQLPEGVAAFGQVLQTRLADSVALITGAVPAEYGFRTAGIVDIKTKQGALEEGGEVGLYGGSHDTLQPHAEYGGSVGGFDYYVAGDYLRNDLGIENPAGTLDAIHDHSEQGKGFLFLSDTLNDHSRVSVIAATSRDQFQIPQVAGQAPQLGLTVNRAADFASRAIDENQREITHFGIVTLQQSFDRFDYQLSGFSRYSSLLFRPDPLPDLLYTGVAQNAYRKSFANGAQLDGSYRLSDVQTLRAGFLVQADRATATTDSRVLPTDAAGAQTGDRPFDIVQTGGRTGLLYGVYLQDEWRPIERLTLNFGGRFDVVDEFTHENQISPRFNAVYQFDDATTLHAGYARYFSPPPFELVASPQIAAFANTSDAPNNFMNSGVKAERSDYFDVGMTRQILPGLNIGLDSYYKDSDSLVDEGQFGAPIILTPFNYSRGRQYGAELTASYQADALRLYGNIAYSSALGRHWASSQYLFTPDDQAYTAAHFIHLDHEQSYTASGGAAYSWETGTAASVDFLYGSGLRAGGDCPNCNSLPPYAQVNLGLSQELPLGGPAPTVLRFDVTNLLDEPYKIRDGSGVGVGAPQYGARRAFYAGVTQRF